MNDKIKIEWVLDEDEDLVLNDLIGNIKITDGKNIIREYDTYIDSWFESLIDGLNNLENSDYVEIEIIEEPSSLIFKKLNGKIYIKYKDEIIYINGKKELKTCILKSLKQLFDYLEKSGIRNLNNNLSLLKLRDFVNKNKEISNLYD